MVGKIKDSLNQFGFWGFTKRVILKLFRCIGVCFEYYYLLELELPSLLLSDCDDKYIWNTKMLEINDFKKSYEINNFLNISKSKLNLFEWRFKHEYEAFGVYYQNDLIYTSWLSYKTLEIPGVDKTTEMPCGYALLLDDFCASHMRKRGIHGYVNNQRLKKLKSKNIKKAFVVVMCGNTPALKSHIKNGFNISFKYFTLSICGVHFSNLQSKLNNLNKS